MSDGDNRAPGPLTGVRVVEVAQALAIPSCGTLLGDLGAEVIKVEPPRGDTYRLQNRTSVKHEGRDFGIANRGKRSICLDLANPETRTVIDKLVASADVMLVSMKAPDVPRYGLDYERVVNAKPDLVYMQNTPYGVEGPLSNDGGYDVVAMGLAGLSAIAAGSTNGSPEFIRPAFADVVTGMMATLGVVAALRHRDLTGEGQRVRTSLFHTALGMVNNFSFQYDDFDREKITEFAEQLAAMRADGANFDEQQAAYHEAFNGRPPGNVYFRHYGTRDGFISVGCLSPRLNERFRTATGLVDPRRGGLYEKGSADERAALDLFVTEAEELLASRDSDDWLATFREHGVPSAKLNFPHEIFDDPQAIANGYVTELEHRDHGTYRIATAPLKMEATPVRTEGVSPRLGEHTDEILTEIGFTADERTDLIDRAIAGASSK